MAVREEGVSEESEDAMRSILVHGCVDGDERTGAVSVPIYQTSTYRQDGIGGMRGYEYSRTGNPTREALEKLIAQLEGGTAGFAFASGLAAITAAIMLLKSGDKVLMSHNVYGGTFRLLDKVFPNLGIGYELVDASDLRLLEASFARSGAQALIIESPTNPIMEVTDIAAAAAIARSHNALTIVDNTFMTPYLQRPLELGADIVVHSATKFLGGHGDLIAGLAVVSRKDLAERLAFLQNATGGILQPFDSWLLLRGIKTLAVRMDREVANAEDIVESLSHSAAVERIYYPGLGGSAGAAVNARQARAGGAVLSFVLAEGYDPVAFSRSLGMIVFGESLGGIETIVTHPATMTHASVPAEIRAKLGITDRLFRISAGIEALGDILADLEHAFAEAKEAFALAHGGTL